LINKNSLSHSGAGLTLLTRGDLRQLVTIGLSVGARRLILGLGLHLTLELLALNVVARLFEESASGLHYLGLLLLLVQHLLRAVASHDGLFLN